MSHSASGFKFIKMFSHTVVGMLLNSGKGGKAPKSMFGYTRSVTFPSPIFVEYHRFF